MRKLPSHSADAPIARTLPTPFHGAMALPAVRIDTYNLDIRHRGERLAARTNKQALKMLLEKWRKAARLSGADPFGDRQSMDIKKKEFDSVLTSADYDGRSIIHGAIEDFSISLALLVERFLLVREWQKTECIVVGGGLRASVTGELIIRRSQAILNARGVRIELRGIHSHPHDAALLGSIFLVPNWKLDGYNAIVAADIGGTNIRVGVVRLHRRKEGDDFEARVWKRVLWRHDQALGRDATVSWICRVMKKLIKQAQGKGLNLAPYIGVGCPGYISMDGSIGTGSEVLPGKWNSPRFHLPSRILARIPTIGSNGSVVLLHNDAVVQGLSEIPFMRRCRRWGVFTVGTGLGNARFTCIQ